MAETVGYQGEVRLDPSKPDGTPRKLLDSARLSALGWRARIGIAEGVAKTYAWLLGELAAGRPLRGLDVWEAGDAC